MRNYYPVKALREELESEATDDVCKETVSDAVRQVMDTLRSKGYNTAGDDRAEELAGAIYGYLKECQAA